MACHTICLSIYSDANLLLKGGHQPNGSSFPCIRHAIFIYSKDGFCLRKARRVVYFHDSLLSTSFPQAETGRASVRHDVAPNGLLAVSLVHSGSTVHIGDYLVRDDHSHAVFLSKIHECTEELSEVHLSRSEFSTT